MGRVAQRITRLTTDQKIAGSNPAVLESRNIFVQLSKTDKVNRPINELPKKFPLRLYCTFPQKKKEK